MKRSPLGEKAVSALSKRLGDARVRILGERGYETLALLRSHRAELEVSFTKSASLLEAYATLAGFDDFVAEASSKLKQAIPSLDPSLAPIAQLHLGRLLTLVGSRIEASTAIATAEALDGSEQTRALTSLARGVLAGTERNVDSAEAELRSAIVQFEALAEPLRASEAKICLAIVLEWTDRCSEGIDLLSEVVMDAPREGWIALQATIALAALFLSRLDLERSEELLTQSSESGLRFGVSDPIHRIAYYRAFAAWWQQDWELARRHLDDVRAAVTAGSAGEAMRHFTCAQFEFDAENFERALVESRLTISLAAALEDSGLVDAARVVEMAAVAALDRRTEALTLFRSLRPTHLDGTRLISHSVMVGITATLLARLATTTEESAGLLAMAEASFRKVPTRNEHGVRFSDESIARRLMLRRAEFYIRRAGLALSFESVPRVVGVDTNGAWIDLANEPRVSLVHRPVLQRVLAKLVQGAATTPGESVSFDELVAAAWPDDRASKGSLRARLRVAVASLRRMALESALRTHSDGYSLLIEA